MPRYELRAGASNKFWTIELKRKSHTVTFGRIGTQGQSKTKSFPSAEAAKKGHDRLIAEKTSKGYRLAAGDAPSSNANHALAPRTKVRTTARRPTAPTGKDAKAPAAAPAPPEPPLPQYPSLAVDPAQAGIHWVVELPSPGDPKRRMIDYVATGRGRPASKIAQSGLCACQGKPDGAMRVYYWNGRISSERIYRDGRLWEIAASYAADGSSLPEREGRVHGGAGTVVRRYASHSSEGYHAGDSRRTDFWHTSLYASGQLANGERVGTWSSYFTRDSKHPAQIEEYRDDGTMVLRRYTFARSGSEEPRLWDEGICRRNELGKWVEHGPFKVFEREGYHVDLFEMGTLVGHVPNLDKVRKAIAGRGPPEAIHERLQKVFKDSLDKEVRRLNDRFGSNEFARHVEWMRTLHAADYRASEGTLRLAERGEIDLPAGVRQHLEQDVAQKRELRQRMATPEQRSEIAEAAPGGSSTPLPPDLKELQALRDTLAPLRTAVLGRIASAVDVSSATAQEQRADPEVGVLIAAEAIRRLYAGEPQTRASIGDVLDRDVPYAPWLAAEYLVGMADDRLFPSFTKEYGERLSEPLGWFTAGRKGVPEHIATWLRAKSKSTSGLVQELVDQLERPGALVRIYLLEAGEEEPAPNAVTHIGGAPIGVSDKDWPAAGDTPLAHLFTLDATDIPELSRLPALGKAAAIAVFGYSNDMPLPKSGIPDCTLIPLGRSQLARGPYTGSKTLSIRPRAVKVEALEVPKDIFNHDLVRSGGDDRVDDETRERLRLLGAIRTQVYRAACFVLGAPIWLQPPQHADKGFVLQFDAGFVDINLGDMGVMYVFSDAGIMQCH